MTRHLVSTPGIQHISDQRSNNPLCGIAFMVIAMALLASMDALAKTLAMDGVAVVQLLALRSVVIVLVLSTTFRVRGKAAELKPVSYKSHAARGAIGFTAPLCFFIGITHIPLTDAVVIFFSSIFFVTIFAIVFLKEKVGIHRWASIVVGFCGVLVVVNPKGGGDVTGYLLVLAGSMSYAVLFVSGRFLTNTESVPSLVLSYSVCTGILSLLLLPWFWIALTVDQYLQILIFSLLALAGHYLVTMAFARSEATALAPFEYTSLIWAILFDLMIWQVIPALSTLLGALIIIASGLYIVNRERIRKVV